MEIKEGRRGEYFNGKLLREYEGNRFSFCEVCDLIFLIKRIPAREELILFASNPTYMRRYDNTMKLDIVPRHAGLYEDQARRILGNQ